MFHVGAQFGRWTVQCEHEQRSGRVSVRCSCGTEGEVDARNLTRGKSQGCRRCGPDAAARARVVHGMADTPIYGVWRAMRQRCSQPTSKSYPHYGGRGITVCERWSDFAAFYADMGDPPPGGTIERVEWDCTPWDERQRILREIEEGADEQAVEDGAPASLWFEGEVPPPGLWFRDEMAGLARLAGATPAEFVERMGRELMKGRKSAVMPVYADQYGRRGAGIQWPDAASFGAPPELLAQVSATFTPSSVRNQRDAGYTGEVQDNDPGPGRRGDDMTEISPDLAAEIRARGLTPTEAMSLFGIFLASTTEPEPATSGRWPSEPPVGTVIRFEKTYRAGEQTYTFLAIRVGDGDAAWYTTANRQASKRTMSWPELAKYIGDTAKVEIATAWFELPALAEPEPEAPASPTDWIAANFGGAGAAENGGANGASNAVTWAPGTEPAGR